jgi:hypothetical protein
VISVRDLDLANVRDQRNQRERSRSLTVKHISRQPDHKGSVAEGEGP